MKKVIIAAGLLALSTGYAAAQGIPGEHFLENWDLDVDGNVSLEEASQRRADVFVMFDADENGELSAQEYELFDKTREEDAAQNGGGHGKGGMRAQEGLTLTFNDVDQNGSVSKDEFVSKTQDWLSMMDRDGDGEVTVKDFSPQN